MPAQKITPRPFRTEFPSDTPKYWANGRPFLTAVLNTYTLLSPDNEQYYMRTLRRVLPRIEDNELKQQILAFFRQEGEHGLAHRRYWSNLRDQGFRIDGFIGLINFVLYRLIEPALTLKTNVAIVAAIEHFNALTGNIFLSRGILRDATPCMRRLMHFHFAEEIEHKSVCMDVFTNIGGKSWLRVLVAICVIPSLYLTFLICTAWLLLQDNQLFRWHTLKDAWRYFFGSDRVALCSIVFWWRYLKPSFHPSSINDYDLAETVFNDDPELAAADAAPAQGKG